MQKLLFSLTLVQLFSLAANNPFENGQNSFESSSYIHQAPLGLIKNMFTSKEQQVAECQTFFNNNNKEVLFLCFTNTTHPKYMALYKEYKEYHDKVLAENTNNAPEENKDNKTKVEDLVITKEPADKDQE